MNVAADNLRVVVVNDFCFVQGGASRVAVDEAVGLAAVGAGVSFLGAVGPPCDELGASGVQIVCLDQGEIAGVFDKPQVAIQGLWNAAAGKAMRGLLAPLDSRCTIVHLHGYTKSLSASPVRVALAMGFRVLLTLHDFFPACPTGGFFNFVAGKACPLTALSAACVMTNCDKRRYSHKLYRVVRSLVQQRFGHLPRGVRDYIALSKKSAQLLRPYLPADAGIHFVGNPIDVRRRPPVDVAANSTVIAIGRLDAEKGIKMLVDAAREAGTPLTLVGDGPLRRYAERYAGCEVTGWLARDQVLARLSSARCLAFPSLWYETYGLAVEEAAASGVPAIVSDLSAAAERVEDGVSGWHLRCGDTRDLVRCLGLAKQDNLVRAAGQRAFERFWGDPPTLERHIEDLLGVYREVLARPP